MQSAFSDMHETAPDKLITSRLKARQPPEDAFWLVLCVLESFGAILRALQDRHPSTAYCYVVFQVPGIS